ncbi:MAG: 2-amino-4-hydroxy-6-hydroxymethyldihydropteridine diphosphokinase, partial [Chitinophagaceae bacterium]|nr:2-amino-4-hydroxy-6-hydroxymethyldihydropteridine diphosphokinase [Chitinophagaceae bacterium]
MNTVYLLLGGNQGNRIENLTIACELIKKELGSIVAVSPIYETAAWGNENQPNFLNQAIKTNTKHSPIETLHIINHIENTLGRQRLEHWGARTLDIDILFYNEIILHSARLVIPHPELQNRRFAL